MVFVDDAHLLDDGSAALVHQLALTGAATVIATVRSGETSPDAIAALWKEGPCERIEVGALDASVIEELLTLVLGAPSTGGLHELVDRCRGNPLFLRELVIEAVEAGTLENKLDIWCLRGPLEPSGRLGDLVALRLANLPRLERVVLELLSIGGPLGRATLEQLTDPGSVAELERKGLVTPRIDGRRAQLWLAQPVFGDGVRMRLSALREHALARSRAEVVESTGARRREDILLLASWRFKGGGGSAELLLAGATEARARRDYQLTRQLAGAAVVEGGGFEARFLTAEAANYLGQSDQAEHDLAALSADAVSDAERARVALLRFDNRYFLTGSANFGLIEEVGRNITDPFWRDKLLARRVHALSMSGGPRQMAEACSSLLQRPWSASLASAYSGVGHCLLRLGRFEEANKLLKAPPGRGPVPAADAPWEEWSLFVVRNRVLTHAGHLHEAEEVLVDAYDQVAHYPEAEARAYVAAELALLHLEQGRARSAIRRADESRAVYQQLGRSLRAEWSTLLKARALALAGQADRAAGALAEYDLMGLAVHEQGDPERMEACGWVAAAGGDLTSRSRSVRSGG